MAEPEYQPGNLDYDYPAKDELINSLCPRPLRELALNELLLERNGVSNVEDAWLFFFTSRSS